MFDLTGKVAIVTGSSKGIGKAIAEALARQGARVVISSRKADACEAVAAAINDEVADGPGEAVAIPAHIGRKEELEALVEKTREVFGPVTTLVGNAALNPVFGPMVDVPDEVFDKMMTGNIKSNHWLAHMVAPDMAAAGGGSIIVISSVGGFRGSANLGTYAITKAADFILVKNLAIDYGPQNIRANCIAPGLVRTDFARALWEDPERREQQETQTPLRRIGEPEDIAPAAVFLAADESSWMTGQTITIDGGALAGG